MSEKQALVDFVTITSALPAVCFSSGRDRCSNQYHAAPNTTNKATALQRIGEVGPQPQRVVAVLQRALQFTDNAAHPTAVFEGFHVLGIEPQRAVEIFDRKVIGALAGIDLTAPVQRVLIVGII